ncbi:MAG: hypothetical protein IJX81_05650 [Clostridia bacterium]|nr:hypothetical protein [Clostridia bacterium]
MNYVKAALFAYPQLGRIGKGYEEHIANKAILSYDGRVATEKLMVYLAGEIQEKRAIERLKALLDKSFVDLSLEERLLLDVRYFGKGNEVKRIFAAIKAGLATPEYAAIPLWSERTYFRKQARLLKKIALRLKTQGVDEKEFLENYAQLDGVGHIYRYLELHEEGVEVSREKSFLEFLSRVR